MTEHFHPRKAFGRNANHGEVDAIQTNLSAENGWIAGEFLPPEGCTEHHHRRAARRLVFVLTKTATQPRLYAEHVEVIRGNQLSALDPRRSFGAGAKANRFRIRVCDYTVVAFGFAG